MADEIAVVIPHYGSFEPTLALIHELRSQVGVDAQIIVSDDCSPEPFPNDLDGVEVVRRASNGGFGAAVNAGIERVVTEYVVILNSDVTLPANFLAMLLSETRKLPPAVIAPRVVEPWGERTVGRTWPTARGMALEACVPLQHFAERSWFQGTLGNVTQSVTSSEPVEVDWAVGVCLLVPTADFRAVKGFDESFFMNCEEIDLQRRLREQRKLAVFVLPEPRLHHVGGGSSPSSMRVGWLVDARMRYYEKWNGTPGLYAALMGVACINLAWQTGRKAAGRDLDPVARFRAETTRIQHAWKARR